MVAAAPQPKASVFDGTEAEAQGKAGGRNEGLEWLQQHRNQRHQSLMERQQKRKERRGVEKKVQNGCSHRR